MFGHTGLQLLAQLGVVEVFANQHDLVLAIAAGPVGVVDGEALASQVKDVAPFALVEPKDPFGAEYGAGQLIVEEILELPQGKRPIGSKGKRREPFNR